MTTNNPTSTFQGLTDLEKFIEKWIEPHGYAAKPSPLALKIDLMEHALGLLRIKYQHFESRVTFEDFIQGRIAADIGGLHFSAPGNKHDIGSGTSAIRLQPKLLLHLLIYHRSQYQVYDIISSYIDKIFSQLRLEDFKRTKTGVYRCFTNTRFAANTLRSYGFLKKTKKEAYKTWVLSLSGFLVAGKLVKDKSWQIPEHRQNWDHDLHPDILQASQQLQTYDQFFDVLSSICEPNKDLFSTFEGVLKKAHGMLKVYWRAINSRDLTQDERREKSLMLLRQIEIIPELELFYAQFSDCLRGEGLLEPLGAAVAKPGLAN